MVYIAHAGEEHVTTNEGISHVVSDNFLAFLAVTVAFTGIIFMIAYMSRPKIAAKHKDD